MCYLEVIKICLVIVYSLLFIDDSIGQGSEEEGVFYGEEEEENFNHISNQGKITLATLYASYIDQLYLQVNTCKMAS